MIELELIASCKVPRYETCLESDTAAELIYTTYLVEGEEKVYNLTVAIGILDNCRVLQHDVNVASSSI